MVRNIIYTIIFAVIVTVSWQVGSILIEKGNITKLLEKHANSTKQYGYYDGMINKKLAEDLKPRGLPTDFMVEKLEEGRKKVSISYQYNGVASVFGYSYYQMNEIITVETKN